MNTKKAYDPSRLNRNAYLVIAWSVLYGSLHLYWLFRGTGYPFQNKELNLFEAMITYLPAQVGGSLLVIICFLGLLVGVEIRKPTRAIPRWFIFTYLWGTAVALILFVPDTSLIASMAYAFLFKFDFSWQMVNQILCIIGALSFGFAAVAFQRKVRNACEHCGRTENDKPFFLVRWGKLITYIAVLAPLPYAITRYAWALGIPLGVDRSFLQDFSSENPIHHIIEWIFGSLCIAGGLLTLGLIQKWGERFPYWFPFIGGKRVPVLLAVIPATCVAIAVTSAGFVFTSSFIAVEFHLVSADNILLSQKWGAFGPMLFWIPWGIALGLATIAYYLRRRGRCGHCGRGEIKSIIKI
ncbi:hypothetical protein [Paenibacillus mendelii]|uniref:DUF3995 domain-containing protein n=1 Tax=Paenibacillus mendelii TaxID=206163 RepID=A0ABV6JK62_9BACL|nr:hypothetical protein [Paenibacillus mendelii]MCQ6564027.1 hypothetical protein [Paenibacillus mendelii]